MNKLTFFENIYYWIWKYIPRIKGSMYPAIEASSVLTLFKVFNIFIGFGLVNTYFDSTAFIKATGHYSIIYLAGVYFIIFLILDKYNMKRYDRQCATIVEKMRSLSHRQRIRKKKVFLSYVIITLVCTVLSFCSLEHDSSEKYCYAIHTNCSMNYLTT